MHLDPESASNWPEINELKLDALTAFKRLAADAGDTYLLPEDGKLAEGSYFTNDEASQPLTRDEVNAGNQNSMSLTK